MYTVRSNNSKIIPLELPVPALVPDEAPPTTGYGDDADPQLR